MPNKIWTRAHKRQSQSTITFGEPAHDQASTHSAGSDSRPSYDDRSETSSLKSGGFFRSRSQKPQGDLLGKAIKSIQRENKSAQAGPSLAGLALLGYPDTHTTGDGERAGVREITEVAREPKRSARTSPRPSQEAVRIAQTPKGQLISQAIVTSQSLHHHPRPASPPSNASLNSRKNSESGSSATDNLTLDSHIHTSATSQAYASSESSPEFSGAISLDHWPQRRLPHPSPKQNKGSSSWERNTTALYNPEPAKSFGSNNPISGDELAAQARNSPDAVLAPGTQGPPALSYAQTPPPIHQPQPTPPGQSKAAQYLHYPTHIAAAANNNTTASALFSTPVPQPLSSSSTEFASNPARTPPRAFTVEHDGTAASHVPNHQLSSSTNLHQDPTITPPYSQLHPLNQQQSRSLSQSPLHLLSDDDDDSPTIMSAPSTAAPLPAPKPIRSSNNRQSIHNIQSTSPGGQHSAQSQQSGPSFQAPPPPPHSSNDRPMGAIGRGTPQPQTQADELSTEEANQLLKDHKELREKYTKVKKYYFEKEEQVKQLQNTLAHQRLAQSRTSLDDSEYTTRLIRLEGLIGQLAFIIRKFWKAVPLWLAGSINKDAIQTGKQEMTAAGRAFISCWLVDEVFEKYFHPDLEPTLSAQLRNVQRSIRRFSPPSQTMEEEEATWTKISNWRLATLDGLADVLRAGHATGYRSQLTELLKEQLIRSLDVHLSDPPMSDLEGGVNMIIELAVGMVAHIPLESRDVIIEYHMPGTQIMPEYMKIETSIPSLGTSVAEDVDAVSTKSNADSDETGNNSNYHDGNGNGSTDRGQKRGMLSAFGGTGKKDGRSSSQGGNKGAGGASSGNRPESAGKEERSDKVRMSVGLSATVRGKNVLVKAPVFGYN